MRIWLIKDGENLPLQAGSRQMRTSLLAAALCQRGCQVDWWTSTFSHQRKTKVATAGQRHQVDANFALNFLECGTYRRNISLARFRHHHRFGMQLEQTLARSVEVAAPDAIVCSFPIIEAAYRVSRWTKEQGIPLVVDARDYWPDLYLERLPSPLRPLGRRVFAAEFHKTRTAFSNADSLVGIGRGILRWACNYAGREPGTNDRVFYTGYPDPEKKDASENLDALPEALRIKLDDCRANQRCVFTFVGMFNGSYRLDVVCEAAKILAARGEHRAQFILAGDGENHARIARIANQLPNTILAGWLDAKAIDQVLRNSNVGLIPCHSHADTMPNKMYEYLALGLPVISSLQGEAEQWLSQHQVGLTYNSSSPAELVQQIQTYLESPLQRRAASIRARKLYETEFNQQQIYSRYADHVISLAARQQQRRAA